VTHQSSAPLLFLQFIISEDVWMEHAKQFKFSTFFRCILHKHLNVADVITAVAENHTIVLQAVTLHQIKGAFHLPTLMTLFLQPKMGLEIFVY
jgi:hypothetical protein